MSKFDFDKWDYPFKWWQKVLFLIYGLIGAGCFLLFMVVVSLF